MCVIDFVSHRCRSAIQFVSLFDVYLLVPFYSMTKSNVVEFSCTIKTKCFLKKPTHDDIIAARKFRLRSDMDCLR